jgi:membrane-associated phospholipid phosphatase
MASFIPPTAFILANWQRMPSFWPLTHSVRYRSVTNTKPSTIATATTTTTTTIIALSFGESHNDDDNSNVERANNMKLSSSALEAGGNTRNHLNHGQQHDDDGYSAILSIAPSNQQNSSISLEASSSPPPSSASVLAFRQSPALSSYWYSRDGTELLVCLSFFVVCAVIPLLFRNLARQRPIPYQQLSTGDYVKNLSFNERFQGDTVSDAWLLVWGVALPLAVQYTVGNMLPELRNEGVAHSTICIYLVAFGINIVCTDLVKAYCGYLRPVFYDLCNPEAAGSASCTSSSRTEAGARRSFPSGHASMSFCGLTLLTLFLHTRLGMPSCPRHGQHRTARQHRGETPEDDYNGVALSQGNENMEATVSGARTTAAASIGITAQNPMRYRCISILSLIPMGLALFIAASRVADNRHFPADVVGGSLLGASIASFVHGLWL